jgi:hypothetical protein
MDHAEELSERAQRIASDVQESVNTLLADDRLTEAKQLVSSAQRDIRDLKRDAVEAERSIRSAAQDARIDVSKQGQFIGNFLGSKGRGSLARGRASARRKLASQQADALRPYAQVKSLADELLSNLDRAKAQITDEAAAQRTRPAAQENQPQAHQSGQTPAPPPPPPTPPTWAPDPSGRHEARYWDGARWTPYVVDQGVQGLDPEPLTGGSQ